MLDRDVDEFMRAIGVLRADGSIDLEQLRKEMHDYKCMIRNVSIVYDNITGGKLSKPTYEPEVVIDAYECNLHAREIGAYEVMKSDLIDFLDKY